MHSSSVAVALRLLIWPSEGRLALQYFKKICILSKPLQFKPRSFKGQLYYNYIFVKHQLFISSYLESNFSFHHKLHLSRQYIKRSNLSQILYKILKIFAKVWLTKIILK